MSATSSRVTPETGPGFLILLGAILGMGYGYLEALEVTLAGRLPGVLAWRTGNSAHVLWFAPAFYGVVGTVVAIPFAVIRRLGVRSQLDAAMVFVYVASGAYLGVSLVEGVLAPWASALLATGLGIQGSRMYRRWRGLGGHGVRLAVAGLLGIAVLCVAVTSVKVLGERRAMAALQPVPGATPNVLLLVMDTQRADHLSAYGYDRPTTPRLDGIAAEGALYEQAYAASSWTLPSHATLFTAALPWEHRSGVIRRPYLDAALPTVAEVLRDRGFATGGFVANPYWCGRQTGLHRGFIRYEDFYHSLEDAVSRTTLGRRLWYSVLPKLRRADVPGRKSAEDVNAHFLSWQKGLDGKPFFAFLNYFDVHSPLIPQAPFAGRFSGDSTVAREREIDIGALTGDMPTETAERIRSRMDRYDESLAYLDHSIGALADSLRARGVLDNTLLIITSDHGESFGEHGMVFHGHSMYRDQIAVPLIVRYPSGIPARLRVTSPVGAEQVPITIMDVVGLPRTRLAGSGRPLPLSDSGRADAVVTGGTARRSLVPANWPTSRGWVTSIVTPSLHFILNEDGRSHLFRIDDLREETDLSSKPEYADSVATFVRRFGASWTRTAGPAPSGR
jgi:arylsulfatase A-like enzyme